MQTQRSRFTFTSTLLALVVPLATACPQIDVNLTTEDDSPASTADPETDPQVTTGDGQGNSETGAPGTTSTTDESTTTASDGGSTVGTTGESGTTNANETTGDEAGESSTGDLAAMCDPLPEPGEPFGECRPVGDVKGRCDGDGKCLSLREGSICQPTCADCIADVDNHFDACIDALSNIEPNGRGECFAGEGCDIVCAEDEDCAAPLVCGHAVTEMGEFNACVWPHGDPPDPPMLCEFDPGTWYGPCRGTCFGGRCIITPSGDICLPPCDVCESGDLDTCAKPLSVPPVPPLVCVVGEFGDTGCAIACDPDGPPVCEGGTVCDEMNQICVWP
jgi:hypothetical protein